MDVRRPVIDGVMNSLRAAFLLRFGIPENLYTYAVKDWSIKHLIRKSFGLSENQRDRFTTLTQMLAFSQISTTFIAARTVQNGYGKA